MNVRLARRVTFSSGHRYWIPSLSESDNRRLFGRWASPFNHGHNYVLWVTAEGPVDPITGMIVNIKAIDQVLQERIVTQFDGRSINDEIGWFHARASSLENLLRYVWDQLDGHLPDVQLIALKLAENERLYAELETSSGSFTEMKMSLTRSYEFAASHRLHSALLPDEANLELYGKCNNPRGHGHNYVLEVTVSGEPAHETGMLVDLEELDRTVEREVVERYDHKHLNEDVPEFQGKVTTSEVVASEIWCRLDGRVPARLERVRLYETPRNMFEVSRGGAPLA
ncbi:MAG TPA: 6-carboxytetrahydropterin synthase [Fimbriimonadaceae bacterium]|nr:6-carboxytetrahydropterin synthase [Fimbriimonadaceae bacterium]